MKKNKISIYIIIIAILVFLISMSPIFSITKVNVIGNELVPTNEILEDANLVVMNKNIFTYSSTKYQRKLKNNAYFSDVNIKKIFPNQIDINITEKNLDFYALYSNNTYLYMNEDGTVMDAKKSYTINKPTIKGLNFDSFTIGQPLIANNQESLTSASTIANTIKRYGEFEDPIIIDVSDPNNIHILVNNVNIVFGDISNCDLKIRRAIAAIPAIDPTLKGYLYVDDINRNTYFKIVV